MRPYDRLGISRLVDTACAAAGGLLLAALMAGCSQVTNTGGGGGGELSLPVAHTQAWVSQVANGSLPPGYSPGQQGTVLNTVESVATDSSGNVILGGFNEAKFSGDSSVVWTNEAFVAKFDGNGRQLWIEQFGNGQGFDSVVSVFTDGEDNVYACGTTTGAFTGYANPGNQLNLMIAVFSGDGTRKYVQQYPTGVLAVSVEGAVGLKPGVIAFWGISLGMTTGTGDSAFVQVIDTGAQATVWKKLYAGRNFASAMASAAGRDLILVGESDGVFPGSAEGTPMPFVLRVGGSDGALKWTQQLEQYGSDHHVFIGLSAVSTDPDGNVVIAGADTQAGALLCAGLCLAPTANDQNAFIAKLNGSSGAVLWAHEFGSGKGDGLTGIAVATQGQIYAVGFTNGVMGKGFVQPGDNIFALSLGSDGAVTWVQQFGTGPWMQGPLPARGIQAAVDTAGNLMIAGETQGAFPGFSNPAGISEIFVAKFGD